MIDRRNFLTGLVASVPVITLIGLPSPAVAMQHRVIQSFTKQTAVGENQMVFFLMHDRNFDSDMAFRFCNEIVHDTKKEYDPEFLFGKDLPVLDCTGERNTKQRNVCNVIRAATRIDNVTRRGRGNKFAQFPDHVLVWYQGNPNFDTPVQRVGENMALHPKFSQYFIKVEGVILSENDIQELEYNGFERIK